ncbi:uncharacterized protein Dwil_GK27690 [Drosophila willistoni]|uniref:Uncharacterized protein n=1 Tax=Drosophila willistoni TaxID=7260 RepID=A0A0Q9WSI4_DROWI|nr:uncharacterized protein Dwil_GK27690 [Drosophila willistoni]
MESRYINNSHAYNHYLRQYPTPRPVVRPRLPIKIYALYRHLAFGSPCEQVQQQQQLRLAGEIQLLLLHFRFRFRMLFAEVPAPTSEPPPTTTAASTVELIAGEFIKQQPSWGH